MLSFTICIYAIQKFNFLTLLSLLSLPLIPSYLSSIVLGHPEDVWFHVDNLSSAHVYIRMKSSNTNNNNGSITSMTIDDLHDELILDCATLVKANSIAGCKVRTGTVATTRNSIQRKRKKGRERERERKEL